MRQQSELRRSGISGLLRQVLPGVLAVILLGGATVAGALHVGCSKDEVVPLADGGNGQVGQPCARTADCSRGLLCGGAGTCQTAGSKGTTGEGDGCAANVDCTIELACASYGTCVKPGSGGVGAVCVGNESCGQGLVCSSGLTCAKPGGPGAKQPRASCDGAKDCALGLICAAGVCTAVSYWPGITCVPDKGPLRAHFEIPRGGKKLLDFYRLPFPNDIRLKNGHPDVTDHPDPGTALPPEYAAVVGGYLKAISEDVSGYGLTTTVLLRLSKDFNLDTIKLDFVNIDKRSPGYGQGVGYSMFATTGGGKYICPNYIAVRNSVGRPLAALTTYAVLLRGGVKDTAGTAAAQDKDFQLVLADTTPTDADELAAWSAYAPLRAYLKDKAVAAADVLSAAVFTTMNPRARMAGLRAAVLGQPAPSAASLTLCDGKSKSPCDDAKDPARGCPTTADAAFHELHGIYDTPAFQAGTPPYKKPADGGAIVWQGGQPQVQRQDKACFALSVPQGATMPASGWPVVIFAHGTGGNFRSFVSGGTAAALAAVKDGSGAPLGSFVVLGIDGAMHGPRRGSTDKPDELFFNLLNPRAARDNTYQGAADKFQLLRLAQGLQLDAAASPTGAALKLDASRVYYLGHSQGAIEGLPFLAFEPGVHGTVLSGAGGYLLGSLLAKTKPLNVAGLVQLALADGQVGTSHPLLNLLQLFFEEVDGLNYGGALFLAPEKGVGGKHTLLSFGVADSYTPPGTISALAWSMGISLVRQEAQRCGDGVCGGSESCKSCAADCGQCPAGTTCGDGICDPKEKCDTCLEDCKPCPSPFPLVDAPVKENVTSEGKKLTAAMVQYVSDGSYDDHFVLFQNPAGKLQHTSFLGSAAKDGAPTIPAKK